MRLRGVAYFEGIRGITGREASNLEPSSPIGSPLAGERFQRVTERMAKTD